jgi:predicted AAA+ superfamily ATPase
VRALSRYFKKDLQLSFLRTAAGAEVDLIIETPLGEVFGIEIKTKAVPDSRDFEGGFAALKKIVPKAKCFCVYSGEVKHVSDGYQIIPYKDFFKLIKSL